MKEEGWFDDIGYLSTILLTGFFKSTVGTSLISLGIGIITYYFVQPSSGFHPATPFMGIILFLAGIIVYFFGDIYKNERKKEEGRVIKDKTQVMVMKEATRIAQAIVDEAEKDKEKAINRKFKQVENGICNDLKLITKDGRELPYCSSVVNDGDNYTRYPDDFPNDEIIKVAVLKLHGFGIPVTKEAIEGNLISLLSFGLISEEKCIDVLDELSRTVI